MTVSLTHRIFDSVGSSATPEASSQPATASALLRELGISHACVEKQKAALRTWLAIHQVERPLRLSMLENGFGLLVKQADTPRVTPGTLA